jgi:sialic acid synthase SpsE
MDGLRRTFGKCIVPRCDLPEGTRLDRAHLTVKKTGGGIPARRFSEVVGKRLRRGVAADEPLTDDVLCD